MATKKKQKLTYKDMMNIIHNMGTEIETTKMFVMNIDQVITSYIEYKKDDEKFKKFLEEKFKPPKEDDKDNKEIKEK
tara:strand:+ start:199 stop:429 length:231 start_codon:yes stop_codon:yes gene_type:complete